MQDFIVGLNDTFLLLLTQVHITRNEEDTIFTNQQGEIILLAENDIIDFILNYNGEKQLPKQLEEHYPITTIDTDNYIQ